jgi:two-component system, OmpR family, phosphate regulon sensor histidine kinase PhoR
MFKSIRWRIAVPYVILFLIAMAGVGYYFTGFVREIYLDQLKEELFREAKLVGSSLSPALESGLSAAEINTLVNSLAEGNDLRITLIDPSGIVKGESEDDYTKMDNHLDRPEIIQAGESGIGYSTRYSHTLGDYLLYAAVPVQQDVKLIGYARVALTTSEIDQSISQLQRTMLGATAIFTIIVIGLAMWVAGISMKPLRELTQETIRIANGEFQPIRTAGWLQVSASDEIGQLTLAFNKMISTVQQQIRELTTERSKMSAVLEEMTDGIVIVDADGNVQLTNKATEAIFQLDPQEITGHSLTSVLRHYEIVELWQRCLDQGVLQSSNLEVGPQMLYLQVTATPLGEILPGSVLLVFQNLTRIRKLETIRQDFISNISHELRTPLASLKALTETLQEGALDDPTAARRFLERIETEVDALSQVVSELLELSRIESGRVPLKFVPIHPRELISAAVERLQLQAERAQLGITVSCPDDLPQILADPQRLEQVLVNLLHNAIKFTGPGGEIEISAWKNEDNQVVFAVRDTGVGIEAEDLTRIFERFYKADRARTGGGTGLGLAISRHLVGAHGGEIWAESEPGKGSTFKFTVPVKD